MAEWNSSSHLSKLEHHLAQAQDAEESGFPLVNYSQGSGGKRMAWTNFIGDWQELSPLQPIVGGINEAHIFQLPTRSTHLALCNQHHLTTLCPKEVTLVPISLYQQCNASSIGLLAYHQKPFKSYLVFLEECPPMDHLASTEWFAFTATHQLVKKKHIKLCGTN